MNDEDQVPDLTPEEYAAVTATFVERLRNAMGNAGCNDVCEDEFPASVVAKYQSDFDVLEAWEQYHQRTEPSGESKGGE